MLRFGTFGIAGILMLSTAQQERTGLSWRPLGLSGGGAMFAPAISPANPRNMMVNCDMSAAYVSEDGGKNWRMIHHAQLRSNTRCRPAWHPTEADTIYAADGWSGLSVSRDAGRTWKRLGNLPGDMQGEIAIDPERPAHMLAGAGGAVWRSADAGAAWTKCDGPTGDPLAFAFDRTSRACFAGTADGVWRSEDGGATWSRRDAGLPRKPLLAFACASNRSTGLCMLYASTSVELAGGTLVGGIYVSRDAGRTWQTAGRQGLNNDTAAFDEWSMGPIAQYRRLAAADADPRIVYAFNTNTGIPPPHHCSVYRSDDAGATWRATFYADPRWKPVTVKPDYTTVEDGQYYQDVPWPAICASDPNRLLLVDMGNCWVTSDGGTSWSAAHTRLAPTAGARAAWVNTGLVVTTTWNHYVDPHRSSYQYIAYTDIGFARSTDSGLTWQWWPLQGRAPWRNTCYELAFDPSTPGKVWGAFSNVHDIPNDNIISGRHNARGPGGVCVSNDFATTWKPLSGGLPVGPCTSVVVDPSSPAGRRTLWAGFFGNGVYRSTDDGATWVPVNAGLGSAQNLRVCRLALHRDGTAFAMITAMRNGRQFLDNGAGLYRLPKGATTWQRVNASPRWWWPKDFTIDPADSRIILVGACDGNGEEQGGLYRTTDGGQKWSRLVRKGPEHFGGYLHPKRKGWIYATLTEGAPDCGLWLSKDNGATWKALAGLPFGNAQRVTVDSANPNAIYVTTFGGSVWHGPAE